MRQLEEAEAEIDRLRRKLAVQAHDLAVSLNERDELKAKLAEYDAARQVIAASRHLIETIDRVSYFAPHTAVGAAMEGVRPWLEEQKATSKGTTEPEMSN